MSFTDEDVSKLTRLLNFVSDKAEFSLKTKEVIEYFGLLSWAQQSLLPSVRSHVLEVKAVHEAPKPRARASKAKK